MTVSTEQLNKAFVVRRTMTVPRIETAEDGRRIRETLKELAGIQKVDVVLHKKRIVVTYDVLQHHFAEIMQILVAAGYVLSQSWRARFKAAWYRYLDENARSNASLKGGACCSNPSDIYASKHKESAK